MNAIVAAMTRKPERHHFTPVGDVQVVRFMNMTGAEAKRHHAPFQARSPVASGR